jgi:hypothetical protein
MKTLRALFFWVSSLFSFKKPVPVIPMEQAITQELPAVNLKQVYKVQADILDTTLTILRFLPKNRINFLMVSHSHAMANLLHAIDNNKEFNPTILADEIEFCKAIQSVIPLQ